MNAILPWVTKLQYPIRHVDGSWTSFHSDLVEETRTYARGLLRCDERRDEERAARRAPYNGPL